MAIKLRKLIHEVDAGEMNEAYAGIVIELLLNAPIVDWQPPWAGIEDEAKKTAARASAPPWERAFYYGMAAQWERVIIPPELTDDGQGEVIEIETAEDYYRLEHRQDFDPGILTWANRQFSRDYAAWVDGALKN